MIRHHEEAWIEAPIEDVWLLVDDPDVAKACNPKLKRVVPITTGARGVGWRFEAHYEMRGKAGTCTGEIIEHDPPRRLAIDYFGGAVGDDEHVHESFRLEPKDGGTEVEHELLMDIRLPWWAKPLIRLLMRFGRPIDATGLDLLKAAAEGRPVEPDDPPRARRIRRLRRERDAAE